MRRLRVLLVYAQGAENASYSYQHGWPDQFRTHPRFDCTAINLADRSVAERAQVAWRARRWRGDAVVLLHSVFSNTCHLAGRLLDTIAAVDVPKAYFIGNEYKGMPEKLAFCRRLGVSLLVSQSHLPAVHALYADRLGCAVVGLPNTGLDPQAFAPVTPETERPIDLGYRSDVHGFYLGHQERSQIAEYFTEHASRLGLRVDISVSPGDRLAGTAWPAFLNRCRGQLGTEAGTDYFDLDDAIRESVNVFVLEHPDATFDDVWVRFFRDYPDPVPMRIISGRNIEAAGTRTVQMMFEGEYGGYFQPDVHYIPLRKDFGNVDEAVAKFKDDAFRESVIDNAYRVATEELTYARLIDRFADDLALLV